MDAAKSHDVHSLGGVSPAEFDEICRVRLELLLFWGLTTCADDCEDGAIEGLIKPTLALRGLLL